MCANDSLQTGRVFFSVQKVQPGSTVLFNFYTRALIPKMLLQNLNKNMRIFLGKELLFHAPSIPLILASGVSTDPVKSANVLTCDNFLMFCCDRSVFFAFNMFLNCFDPFYFFE